MALFEIFRAGVHTASNGTRLPFTESDLAQAARVYNPGIHSAPIVKGHPTDDQPAHGWIKSVTYKDGRLFAEAQDVDPQLALDVKAGRYRFNSPSFYLPDSPINPVPGTLYLKHLGVLGAVAPSLKGQPRMEFGEGGPDGGIVEFTVQPPVVEDSMATEEKEKVMDPPAREDPAPEVAPPDPPTPEAKPRQPGVPGAAAGLTPAAFAEQEAAFAERERQLQEREAQIRTAEEAERTRVQEATFAENRRFVDDLVTKGRVLPVHREGLAQALSLSGGGLLSFGEGDGKTNTPLAEWLKDFLQTLPKQVEFGEIAPTTETGASATATVNFAAAAGYGVDMNGLELHNKALAYQKANPNTSYLDAVKASGG